MTRNMRDALKKVTKALPNGAAAVTSDAIDTEKGTRGEHLQDIELLLSAPALNVTEQPNAKTMIYDIISSANSDLSSPTTVVAAAITQTGAGGAGAAAATYRYKLPTSGARYWGAKATGSASGNATTASLTLEMLF